MQLSRKDSPLPPEAATARAILQLIHSITMGQYSIGEALRHLLDKSQWTPKVLELRIKQDWEAIVGKTIARYTTSVSLNGTTLTVITEVAPLKQELLLGKDGLIARINEHLGERAVTEVVIR